MGAIQAVLSGYYGQGNGGDEALLATLLELLPPQVIPVVLSGNPDQTRDRYGVDAYYYKSPTAVLSVVRQSQALIWGGGSLIQDATSAANPFYYGGLMRLAQGLGLKTIAWAQGIGPLNRPVSRWIARQAFQSCTQISVRDPGSLQWLHDWKLSGLMAPDPVWALTAQPVPELWTLHAPRIAVSLRSHPLLTPARLERLTQALIAFQKATEVCVLLVPFQPSKDGAIARQLQSQMPGPSAVVELDDPRQLKGLFRGVELAISMRFHGLIMAAAEGCRCFALSYDPKVSQLMQTLDIPGWELDNLPEEAIAISQTWLDYYANGEPLSPIQIQAQGDRARLHQELLQTVF